VPNYTLVCYRPNGVDTCMSCVRDRSDSEFELWSGLVDCVVERWAGLLFRDHVEKTYAVCSWDVTLLINGLQEHDDFWYDDYGNHIAEELHEQFATIFSKATALADIKIAECVAKEEHKKEQDALKIQQQKEERERQQLRRLKAKYEK
jgi:hypothetical protein